MTEKTPSFNEEEKQEIEEKIIDIRKKQINQLQETPEESEVNQ